MTTPKQRPDGIADDAAAQRVRHRLAELDAAIAAVDERLAAIDAKEGSLAAERHLGRRTADADLVDLARQREQPATERRQLAAERTALAAELAVWTAGNVEREREAIRADAADLAATINETYRTRADALVALRRIDGELLALRDDGARLRRRGAAAGVAVDVPVPIIERPEEAKQPEAAGARFLHRRGLAPPPAFEPDPIAAGARQAGQAMGAVRRADRAAGLPVSGPRAIPQPQGGSS